VDIEESYVA